MLIIVTKEVKESTKGFKGTNLIQINSMTKEIVSFNLVCELLHL